MTVVGTETSVGGCKFLETLKLSQPGAVSQVFRGHRRNVVLFCLQSVTLFIRGRCTVY